jgi:hypothetical protein
VQSFHRSRRALVNKILFTSALLHRLQGGSSPRPGSEFNIVQVNAEKGELFALYPTDYPAILHNRVPGAVCPLVFDVVQMDDMLSVLRRGRVEGDRASNQREVVGPSL